MRAAATDRGSRAAIFLARAVAILALALVGQVWAAAPSHAAGGACAPGAGVTVVVQWKSSVQTRCAIGPQGSALVALQVAGFTPARASQQAGYFLCRIDGNPASDPCFRAAPADAYWSFWTAAAGGSWAYSNVGVASYAPPKGSVIGFRFGAGAAPAIAPPVGSAPAPRPSPPSTTPAPAPSASRPAPRPSSSRPAPPAGSDRPATATAAGSTTPGPVARSRSGSAPTAWSSSGTTTSAARAATSASSSSGRAAGSTPASSTSASTGAAIPRTTTSAAAPQGDGAATQAGAAPSVATGTSGSGGSLTGVAVGAGVLALLGAGALIARKRLQ